uniref:Uncharacterized protein n=1 Tax=Anguilla anguilla TaxID=7936 RepID=A0A0E9PV52_ANGAN
MQRCVVLWKVRSADQAYTSRGSVNSQNCTVKKVDRVRDGDQCVTR